MFQLINKILGDPNERKIKKLSPLVDMINQLEPEIAKLSDDELRAKTDWFKNELANRPRDLQNERKDRQLEEEALEWLLPEAFAVVREAGKRVLGMRHYDVQLIGGIILHQGGISEMRTGEGKTLVATLPAYLNALTGKGVHVITVNDYLAQRDAEWMGQLYKFLGLTVGVVLSGQMHQPNGAALKHASYQADITYGTNNEFGFDYLRDNMANALSMQCQRPYNFAIIDEVDSILIDEARTPLIISGRVAQSAELYNSMAALAPKLTIDEDYTVDEKARNVILTEDGIDKAQDLLDVDDLFDIKTNYAHHLLQALKAKELFQRDTDYVVKEGQVAIVDEFTGRLMEGRRWSDGLHQAVEAKEGVSIQDETQTLASITYQNLFRLYPKLSGMTGTALTEEAEFGKIYNLSVTAIPTNRPDKREDMNDVIYKTEAVKYVTMMEDMLEFHEKGRPILVGTTSIEKSELVSKLLSKPDAMINHLQSKTAYLKKYIGDDKTHLDHLNVLFDKPEQHDKSVFEALADNKDLRPDVQEYVRGLAKTKNAVEQIKQGVKHHVLNAKHHEQEAFIVAQAGRKGAITVATNMAGRGTDILLGGNPELLAKQELIESGKDWRELSEEEMEALTAKKKDITDAEKEDVIALGGLHIIGTERHESRRIDNQLRGRAARQGDPGSTHFYLSLEDNLMRIFGGQRVSGLMDMLNVDESMPIAAKMVTNVIEGAQRKVEAYHFDIRKNVLKYDDVLTEQRKLIYDQRRQVLEGFTLRENMIHMMEQEISRLITTHIPPEGHLEDWEEEPVKDMLAQLHAQFPQLQHIDNDDIDKQTQQDLVIKLQHDVVEAYERIESQLVDVSSQLQEEHGISLLGLDAEIEQLSQRMKERVEALSDEERQHYSHPLRRVERDILLSVIDNKWIDYLHNLDALREGIGLRAYGQKDPLLEYKREAFDMFQAMTFEVQRDVTSLLFRSKIEIQLEQPVGTEELLAEETPQGLNDSDPPAPVEA